MMKMMSWAQVVFIMVIAISGFLPPGAVADVLPPSSPLLSPLLNGICNVVNCGKGTCEASLNYTFGFACVCNPGWRRHRIDDDFRFLPCVIPNCSIDYSCSKDSAAPAAAPLPPPPPPSNDSIFDACMWSYCGGGKCFGTSHYEHKCECDEGYGNLFNVTSFPCYKECSLGADCSSLGISLSNSTSALAYSPNMPDNGSSAAPDASAPVNTLWLLTLAISLAIIRLI